MEKLRAGHSLLPTQLGEKNYQTEITTVSYKGERWRWSRPEGAPGQDSSFSPQELRTGTQLGSGSAHHHPPVRGKQTVHCADRPGRARRLTDFQRKDGEKCAAPQSRVRGKHAGRSRATAGDSLAIRGQHGAQALGRQLGSQPSSSLATSHTHPPALVHIQDPQATENSPWFSYSSGRKMA